MDSGLHIFIGKEAVRPLVDFCRSLAAPRLSLVADTNTYAALGQQVETAFKAAGFTTTMILLKGAEIAADEKTLLQVLVESPPGDQTFIAVGTGTITDIVRYISFRTRNPFIAVPTAPSVDGFVSSGAPLIIDGIKETYRAQGPIAVFVDLRTSALAPAELKAAGFSDMVGKLTSLADWKLGYLLWNEPYDPVIEQRVRRALEDCLKSVNGIVDNQEPALSTLMNALIESGRCMLDFGDSRPASGSEHHCSHFWEIQLLRTHRKALLHGAKVGYATTLIARLYEQIRAWSRDEAAARLRQSRLPDYEAEVEQIRAVYGAGAELIVRSHAPFLTMTGAQFDALKARIIDGWDEIQAIARAVPPASHIAAILSRTGAPTRAGALGLDEDAVLAALRYGHYLRSRFTVIKLMRVCGLDIATLFDKV